MMHLPSRFLAWLQTNDPPSDHTLGHILRVLRSGGSKPEDLAALSSAKATLGAINGHRPCWYAVWVDSAPDTGIVAVTNWLATLPPSEATRDAQLFVTSLTGNPYDVDSGPSFGNFLTPRHLKRLYVLMHEHIRIGEDINRVGGGVYSPDLRDQAQEARDTLFRLLANIPGKETYVALAELTRDHPVPGHRAWMARRAFQRGANGRRYRLVERGAGARVRWRPHDNARYPAATVRSGRLPNHRFKALARARK